MDDKTYGFRNGKRRWRRNYHADGRDGYSGHCDCSRYRLSAFHVKQRKRNDSRRFQVYVVMTRIKDLPLNERPREKAQKYGITSLSTNEILALIIGSGVKNMSAIDISQHLLDDYRGLASLITVSYKNLVKQKGLSVGNAYKLIAAFELIKRVEKATADQETIFKNSKDIFSKYRVEFSTSPQELLLLIMLNRNNKVIKEEIIFKGMISSMLISFREIFVKLFSNDALKFVLVHNHPGGNAEPSKEDIATTINIRNEAAKLGLELLDHIVIANHAYYSMSEHFLI